MCLCSQSLSFLALTLVFSCVYDFPFFSQTSVKKAISTSLFSMSSLKFIILGKKDLILKHNILGRLTAWRALLSFLMVFIHEGSLAEVNGLGLKPTWTGILFDSGVSDNSKSHEDKEENDIFPSI